MSDGETHERLNPYAVTVDADAERVERPLGGPAPPVRQRLMFGLAAVIYIGCVITAVLACYDIETIVGSGPTMFVIAMLAAITTRRVPLSKVFRLQAVAVMGACIFCVLWINLFSLSPRQAQFSVGCFIVAFALAMQTQWPVWSRQRRRIRDHGDKSL